MRRFFIAFAAVVALAGSAVAQEQQAAKKVTKQELQAVTEAAPLMPLTLTTLFRVAGDQFVTSGVWIPAEVPHVVIARKNDDGSVSVGCVSTAQSMKTFMERQHRDVPAAPAEQ